LWKFNSLLPHINRVLILNFPFYFLSSLEDRVRRRTLRRTSKGMCSWCSVVARFLRCDFRVRFGKLKRRTCTIRKLLALVALGVAVAVGCLPGFAHHGSAAYDTNNTLAFKATITEFQFINPHCQVFFDIKNDKGEVEHWQGELTAPNKLARADWPKHSLNPGDQITVSGFVPRNGAHSLWIRKIISPDGQPMQLSERV
jgi:hypothetical protein